MNNLSEVQKVIATEKIEEFLKTLNVDNLDIESGVNIEDIALDDAYNSICEQLAENGSFDVEIIYYNTAMQYLLDNDCSLKESLEMAEDLGYTPSNLSSEVLASLLASQVVRVDFSELEDTINSFFEELIKDLEDLEEED